MTAHWRTPAGLHMSPARLHVEGRLPSFDSAPVDASGAEVPADWASQRSPENYTGYGRTANLASPGGAVPGERHRYKAPDMLRLNSSSAGYPSPPPTARQAPGEPDGS